MNNYTANLDAKLEEIQEGAATQVTLYNSARTQLYKNLVGAYLWWREARITEGYLEQLYADEDIGFRKSTGNRPNFHPLVRLVFKLQQHVEAMQISNWAHAIAALDDEYTAKPFIYKNRGNAAGELIDFIGDNGGVSGLRKLNDEQIEEFGDEVFQPIKQKKTPSKKVIGKKIKTQTQVLKHKKQQIAEANESKTIEIGEVATNEEDLIVVLARRNDKSGKLTVVGSTADDDAINKAIMECAQIDFSTAPPSLRVIAESLKPSVIPQQMQKRKLRNNFFTKTKIKVEDGEKAVEMREETRLIIRADNTILVSKIRSKASLTTIAYPTFEFGLQTDVFLRGSDRYFLETEMLNEGQIVLYTAVPVKALADGNKNVSATKQLTLHNKLANTSRNIYFYNTDIIDTQLAFQPTVSCSDKIQFDWKIVASHNYIRRLNAQHFEEWIHHTNKRIHIPHNKTMQLLIHNDCIEVRSRFERNAQSYSRFGADFQTALNGDATITKVADENHITVSPLDIVELFASLTSLNIAGAVIIEGNEHIMRVSYETDIAKYETFIPACSVTGKRDDTYFAEYAANE